MDYTSILMTDAVFWRCMWSTDVPCYRDMIDNFIFLFFIPSFTVWNSKKKKSSLAIFLMLPSVFLLMSLFVEEQNLKG